MSLQDCYPNKAPAINDLLDTLSHHVRREIIHYFEDCLEEDTAEVAELVTYIENRVPDQCRKQVRVQLHHTHLPKLTSRGWVDYDRETEQIRYHGHENAEFFAGEIYDMF
ncbi:MULTISPECIES: DUF7344 domain-containing protein [Haloarcula]|uniref:DUF7344 domain-containing protein n=1 Tax=Haloarcula pellucida TaxID=1427151 RepID=A0A830GKE2_9EURY|nr:MULTISPECIES: hypothetical protein [Halomicroarcula]MBX0348403.1 hypothetical protein [Halomicroarcula pellucida]MDS0278227.1 hypothetical protein [Halomicroarcula sp. S1AR25-4]GGN93536.1 hypothetical protein GCM10009030_19050 [Halomicroarcula pellucida]